MSNDPTTDDRFDDPYSNNTTAFRRGAVRPMECLREGWGLIKNRYWLYFGITLVAMLIGSAAPFAILMGPMMCGVHYCFIRRERGQEVKFEDLFKGFQYFMQSFIATLISMIPVIIIVVPMYIAMVIYMISMTPTPPPGGGAPPPPNPNMFVNFMVMMFVFTFAVIVVTGLVSLFFFFMYPLIVDRKLSGWEAVKLSAKAAMGNLGGIIGLLFLQYLLSFIGLLACYVGAFFVIPLTLASTAVAYRKVFPEIEERYLHNQPKSPNELDYDDNAE
jgi:uncharacterized membrane protein